MRKLFPIALAALFLYACSGGNTSNPVTEISQEITAKYVPDKRVGVFKITSEVSGKQVLLKGSTDHPEAISELITRLEEQQFQVVDSVRRLPDAGVLEGKTYGVVNISVCNLRIKPDFSEEMVTQALLGMPVKLLDKSGWYHVQTPDNYLAWVHRVGVHPMTKEEYNAWNFADKVVVTSHYGFTYEKADESSQSVTDVVSGNRLKYEGTEKNFYKVSYPDGKMAYISKSISKTEKEWRASLKQDAESILKTAKTLMGIPYLWAGTSSKGVDCSGFVRTVLFLHDIIMPRDASQQAYVGEHIDIASDFSNMQPGDLIFFGRKATAERKERVVHVGIYIGNKNFIHSQGDVRINSFDPAHSNYDEYNLNRLLFATRMLNAIGTPQINTTLTNTYYLPQ
ncbi:hypothetical protein D0T50_00810 [Bacteroides sp. 214]|uniref:C40 family peptidase n=1 Tax=Bacteroides sp. 214 TaxID=2302935 RepID=UPI0013D0E00C|nr:C40 family peptidase [Bacteroides sp. 214]NDW11428.1 hypothetical protein [Bacteroides sp. 214]